MSIENEVKIRIEDLEDFLRRLEKLRPRVLSERHFEDNFVLDFPDRAIASRQCLIRVRITDNTSLLTFKGPPLPQGLFKTREELESTVGSGPVVLAILQQIGLAVWFRYQKYRREYRIVAGRKPATEIHVALDETPIGTFAEFEGSGVGIKQLARRMGLRQSQFLRDSYAALYVQFCAARGLPVRHMTFKTPRPSNAGKTKRKDKS